ncbi:MAG: hypothetical protein ACK442_11015 [Novosphingobium sp.]|jgi:hypothetical protein|nr:hypothetical protein [Novosphingobium sp.]
MNLTRDRLHSIGWVALLVTCAVLTLVLMVRVNAVKSEVQLAQRQINALKQERLELETEFLTRANQQQLRNLNALEFGYQAPTAGQYIEGERQLAALGKGRSPDAPSPIRVASAAALSEDDSIFPAMVSPLTGRAMAAEVRDDGARRVIKPADLTDRLSKVERPAAEKASAREAGRE